MAIITTWPFSSSGDYTFTGSVEVTGGLARLTQGAAGKEFTEAFSSSTGFTYDSNTAEFNGTEFYSATFGANYAADINGNWGSGTLTGTATGGASVAAGKLSLINTDTRYVDYAGVGNADVLVNEGCIRFKVTPNYSGTPAASKNFITVCQAAGNTNNEISIEQVSGTGNLNIRVRDSSGGFIFYSAFVAAWAPVSGTEYEFEFNFDTFNGYSRLFIDGTQAGATDTNKGTRSSSIGLLRVGSDVTASMTSNFAIDDVMIFSKPQHHANYTAGYTVGSTNALSGLYQKATVNEDCSAYATYTSSINFSFSRGTNTGTATGGAAITANRLDLTGGGVKYVDYAGALNGDYTQQGAIKFKLRPNYSGNPPSDYTFFTISQAAGSTNNLITLFHRNSDQNLRLRILDSTGTAIMQTSLGLWAPVSGTTYEIELNYNITTGATRLYVDGLQFGATNTSTGTRSSNITLVRVGSNQTGADSNDCYIEDFMIFDWVQHTTNYTSGYTLYEGKYDEIAVTCPTKTYSGYQQIESWEDFSLATEVGSPRYVCNNNYWTGAAWAATSNTYATAASESDTNDNIFLLTAADTMIVKVVFQSSMTVRSGVDTMVVGYSDASYNTSNPTIYPTTAINSNSLTAFSATTTVAGSDAVRFTVQRGGTEMYWTGATWAASSGYAQSNTAAEINTNCATLTLTGGYAIRIIVYLHSDSGATTPSIDTMSLTYEFEAADPTAPNECAVYGFIYDATGTPQTGVVVSAKLTAIGLYNGQITVSQKVISATTAVDGYWELSLINNAEMQASIGYEFTILGEGVYSVANKIVPNQASSNYADLADLP